jgi:hypothetical protein
MDNIWVKFVNEPNEANYTVCQQQIKDSLYGEYERFKSPTYLDLMQDYLLGKVTDLIKKGNIYATHLGFQFYPLFRGNAEVIEFLNIALGKWIKKDPESFLMLLKLYTERYENNPYHLEGILGNYGDEFVDKLDRLLQETQERIEALQKVQKEDLKELRNQCIKSLKELKASLQYLKEKMDSGKLDVQETLIDDPTLLD